MVVVGLDTWLTVKRAWDAFWTGMDVIMHVQRFFGNFALVIGILVAEIIGAFWAMGTT